MNGPSSHHLSHFTVIVDNARFSTSEILHPTGDFARVLRMKMPKITRDNYNMAVVGQPVQVRKEIIRRPSEVLASKKCLSSFVANMSQRMSMSQVNVRTTISREALTNLRRDVSRLSLQYAKKTGSITSSAASRSSIASNKNKRLMIKRVPRENFSSSLPPLYNTNKINITRNSREFVGVLSDLLARSLMSSNREFLLNKLTQPHNSQVKRSKPNLTLNVVSRTKPSHPSSARKPTSPSNSTAKVRRTQSVRKTDSSSSSIKFPSSAQLLQTYLRHTLYT